MKSKSIALLITLIIATLPAWAQTAASWEVPTIRVNYQEENGQRAVLEVDSGFRYADLNYQDRNYRLFYQHNRAMIKNIRIVDQDSKLQIARGRGGSFWGNSRVVFVDGTEIRIKRKNFANGYEVTGPNGPLFRIENHAYAPTKTNGESEFLTQAMFMFRRIQYTQKPDVNVIYDYYPLQTYTAK